MCVPFSFFREKICYLQHEVLQVLEKHVHATLAAALGLTDSCKVWAVKVGQAERELAELECGWMAVQDERQRLLIIIICSLP